MPNLDGGHYFLTILVPVKVGLVDPKHEDPTSHVHALRSALSRLAPAQQSVATVEARDGNSPFTRSRRTHFARLFIIEDVAYNGRTGANSLVTAVAKTVLTDPQPVDKLASPFLCFVVDFDPDPSGVIEPDDYLCHLWTVMRDELHEVFQHCVGFETVHDGASFAAYLRRGQIETTMPFNDYWITPPPLPSISLWALGLPVAVPALATVVALIGGLAALFFGWPANPWIIGTAIGLCVTAAALVADYFVVMHKGAKPFPSAPNSDLKSILKSLYLQQKFTDFVIANQAADPTALLANFKGFVEANVPSDLDRATQSPGVIRS